ncbi:MAG TPA: hydrogenase maturation protease [Candidatus Saccharimonadales bacterium]|nr:hydrogenase maturation protease [Candidatus Saccharimonadales bacterium]
MRVLVAGMGNELRGDDGFGVVVTHLLAERDLGAEVTVKEFGIGGISLVQELLTKYDALLIVDAVHQGSAPGTIHLLEPAVVDIADLPDEVRRDFLADVHWADPGRALILAKALGVLPPRVLILGCQPQDVEDLTMVLTPSVEASLPRAMVALDEAIMRLTA